MIRVPYEEMKFQFERVLRSRGMGEAETLLCARLLADTSLEGVYTHGAHRFPALISFIDRGIVDVHKKATLSASFGVLERWDGNSGVGNLNAHAAMSRAIELAKAHAVGIVALKNTNHWMRPGAYGIMAAEAGCIGSLWTNTLPLMPAWGGLDATIGNNPLVIAIPSPEGILLVDMAMSLFSYGKMEGYVREGKPLPVPGGWDRDGTLTDDPQSILESKRPLPVGFWKGTSLALALDLVAAALSGGNTTADIRGMEEERDVSQVFIAVNLASFPDRTEIEARIASSLAAVNASQPIEAGSEVRWPGQNRLKVREENLREGIPTDEGVWKTILSL